jgi:hypothetical protein
LLEWAIVTPFERRLAVLFLACALPLAAAACGEADPDALPDLGPYGEAVRQDAQTAAREAFLASAAARERFAQAYPALHHRADAEALLTALAADPALSPLAERIRTSLKADLTAPHAKRVRERWSDPAVQRAVTHSVAQGLLAALEQTAPAPQPADAQPTAAISRMIPAAGATADASQ